jgi:hypothetical protein
VKGKSEGRTIGSGSDNGAYADGDGKGIHTETDGNN